MIEEIQKLFFELEKEHYIVLNKYLTGRITISEVNAFGQKIEQLCAILDNYEPTEENMLEIAGYKSKIQHFYTEIMEDEELLGMAYNNNLSLYR